ncbi:MAG TPA: hypothetical protein VIJ92_15475 [Ginsengibacter sp.]
MAKVRDYVVITSSKGVENLESLIKENISLGWQPLGGVGATTVLKDASDGAAPTPVVIFAQAMVLFE